MKRTINILLLMLLLFLCGSVNAQKELHPAYKAQLYQLNEAYNILEKFSSKIWPGWNEFMAPSFIYVYPNGAEVLVGTPEIKGFEKIENKNVKGREVYLKTTNLINAKMDLPMDGGGGVQPLGPGPDGKQRFSVRLDFQSVKPSELHAPNYTLIENRILVNIHELFHIFQYNSYQMKYSYFFFNNDVNYALYAEIEGIALERAYTAKSKDEAVMYIKDFLLARELKRNSLTDLEIVTNDVDAMCSLYSKLFGALFTAPVPELGNARTAKIEGEITLGIRLPMHDVEQPVVRPYYLVESIESAVKDAKAAGANILLERMEIPGHGIIAIYEFGGIQQGLWQL